MRKIYLALLAGLLISISSLRATNVVIIASSPYTMDVSWDSVAVALGFNTSIYQQTALDSTYWFATTDILIVSDGVTAYTQAEISNIQAYLQGGGKVYLQGEYDCNAYTANTGFAEIVDSLGGAFNLVGITAGDLEPMQVLGSLSTTPNIVDTLSYFWYGCAGMPGSCNSHVEPFLTYGGQYFGFIFCPPVGSGRMISTSDQDWVQSRTSPSLQANILLNLADSNYACVTLDTGGLSVNLGPDTAVCNGQTVVLDAGNAGSTYLWSNAATTEIISVNTVGSYSVTVTGSSGCSAISSITIAQDTVPITDSVINATCGQSNGVLSVFPGGGNSPYDYLWNTGDTSATLSNLAAGTYNITVTDAGGCTGSATEVISTTSLPNPLITASDTLFCANDSSLICAPAGFAVYAWNNSATTPCFYTNLAGNYYVMVTDSNNCTASSNHLAISVLPLPPVSIAVNGDTLVANNGLTFQWYLNDTLIPGATGNIWIATQSGSYTLLISDSDGCYSTSSVVKIETGIRKISNDGDIAVYPNPLQSGAWTLKVAYDLLGSKAEIFDDEGRLVYAATITEPISKIDFAAARGVYMLTIISNNQFFVSKLVKL